MTRSFFPASGAKTPLILDFDASVLPLGRGETRVPLGELQETVRFGCSPHEFATLEARLRAALPPDYGCVFLGSGDYHHVTLFLLREAARRSGAGRGSLDVVVCDNHPDNMLYPFGAHCGSWAGAAALLDCVRRVHVIGVCSPDIGWKHAWENRLSPLLRGKLTYWSVNRRAPWLKLLGREERCKSFPSASALVDAFLPVLKDSEAVYLSLDKDVFSPETAQTTWDQGEFAFADVAAVVEACAGKGAGVDVCGDASVYRHAGRFKRLLSRLDGAREFSPEWLRLRREEHRVVNAAFLDLLA